MRLALVKLQIRRDSCFVAPIVYFHLVLPFQCPRGREIPHELRCVIVTLCYFKRYPFQAIAVKLNLKKRIVARIFQQAEDWESPATEFRDILTYVRSR
jgi:hypothetical protein